MTDEKQIGFGALESAESLRIDGANYRSMIDRLDRLWSQEQMPLLGVTEATIGAYRLQQVVGVGAFGVVYLALDTERKRTVALKMPRLEVLMDPEKRERFSAEGALVATLDHPGIVRVYETRSTGPHPYIVSEFCDGPNLAQWIAEREVQPSWQSIAHLVAVVADAVEYAHSQGVIHRDLKPANIMLVATEEASDGRKEAWFEGEASFSPKLTDFGLAKFTDFESADTRSSQMIGTPLYMAPERLAGVRASVAADVYSLGVVLFELLTGQPPIDGDRYIDLIGNIRQQPPRRLRSIRGDLPAGLEQICAKCLEKEPGARYETAGDLANDLRRCIAAKPLQGRSPTWRRRLAYWCSQPARVANAGWFAVISHVVLIAWIASAVVLLPIRFEFGDVQWSRQIYQMLYGVCLSIGPVILLGWLVLRGHRWAIYVGFLVTLGKIPAQFRAMVFKPVYFPDLYETGGVYVFMDHFIVAVLLIFQLFIFGCAVAADRKHQFPSN